MLDVEVEFVLVEHAFAKINLTLDVLRKRPDGYHEVDMVMQTVDLADLVWLEERPEGDIRLASDASHIPLDQRNLAHVAVRAFQAATGIQRGVSIRIDKTIPVAAGLAGGSSDAAAVLRGLNRLWGVHWPIEKLAELGASIGSDVPFCVYRGCAVASGRGEKIARVEHDVRAWVVLVRPPVYVSTADAYGGLTEANLTQRPASPSMVEALQSGDFESVLSRVSNGLEPVTLRMYPEVAELKERMQSITGFPVFMSGSGPTLFTLVPSRVVGQRVYNALRGFIKEVYLCRFVDV